MNAAGSRYLGMSKYWNKENHILKIQEVIKNDITFELAIGEVITLMYLKWPCINFQNRVPVTQSYFNIYS